MSIIYSEPYYDQYDKQYVHILTCETQEPDILDMCTRFLRKPLSSFQNMNYQYCSNNHSLCSYAFKNQHCQGKMMTLEDMPQLFMILSQSYDFDYKMGKLIEKQNIGEYGRKFICILHKKQPNASTIH